MLQKQHRDQRETTHRAAQAQVPDREVVFEISTLAFVFGDGMPVKLHVPIKTPDTRGPGIAILVFKGVIFDDIDYRTDHNGFVLCDSIKKRLKPTYKGT